MCLCASSLPLRRSTRSSASCSSDSSSTRTRRSPINERPIRTPSRSPSTALSDSAKVAVTCLATSIVTSQVSDEPEHAPPQLSREWFSSGTAVSVTFVPSANCSEQSGGQLIPGPVTLPAPDTETSSVRDAGPPPSPPPPPPAGSGANIAVTFRAWVIVTTHWPDPEQSPDQLSNI